MGSAGKTKAWWVVFGVGVGGYAKVKREGETLEGCGEVCARGLHLLPLPQSAFSNAPLPNNGLHQCAGGGVTGVSAPNNGAISAHMTVPTQLL